MRTKDQLLNNDGWHVSAQRSPRKQTTNHDKKDVVGSGNGNCSLRHIPLSIPSMRRKQFRGLACPSGFVVVHEIEKDTASQLTVRPLTPFNYNIRDLYSARTFSTWQTTRDSAPAFPISNRT